MNFAKQIVGALTVTIALVLMASVTVTLTGCDTTVNEADTSSTTTTINNPEEQPFNATGTVSGRVIDRVTSAPIEGATVAIDALDSTATTDAAGSFRFDNVPATSNVNGTSASGTYNVHITTPDGSPYRTAYTAEVTLSFGLDEVSVGSGPGNNLGASVTFPLAKLNGTISGSVFTQSAFTGDRLPTADEEIVLYQDLDLRYDDDGGPIDNDRVRVASTQTGADGSFTFENVEEAADYDLEIVFAGKEGVVFETGTISPDAGSGSTVTLEPVDVTGDLADFEVTLVSPQRNDDLSTGTPEFVFAFTSPIAENDYTDPTNVGDIVTGNGVDNIANNLFFSNPAAKNALGPATFSNIEFNDTRDTVRVTPAQALPDGTTHELFIGAFGQAALGFVDVYGQGVSNLTNPVVPFSIGIEQGAPDAPTPVSVTVPDQRDYTDGSLSALLEFRPSDSTVPVRGYEVYVRTADVDDDPERGDGDFEQLNFFRVDGNTSFGITTGNGDVNAFNVGSTPFYGEDGGDYEPVAWYFRAVSINGVQSAPSDTIEVGDNVEPQLFSASLQNVDNDSDGELEIVLSYSEPIDGPTAGDYTVDRAGTSQTVTGVDTDYSVGGPFEVVLFIDGGAQSGDDVVAADQTDLAGNDIDTDNDEATAL